MPTWFPQVADTPPGKAATVHLASRMENLAQPGAIYITDATYELAEGHISARSLGDVSVKGISTPVKT